MSTSRSAVDSVESADVEHIHLPSFPNHGPDNRQYIDQKFKVLINAFIRQNTEALQPIIPTDVYKLMFDFVTISRYRQLTFTSEELAVILSKSTNDEKWICAVFKMYNMQFKCEFSGYYPAACFKHDKKKQEYYTESK